MASFMEEESKAKLQAISDASEPLTDAEIEEQRLKWAQTSEIFCADTNPKSIFGGRKNIILVHMNNLENYPYLVISGDLKSTYLAEHDVTNLRLIEIPKLEGADDETPDQEDANANGTSVDSRPKL